MRSLQELGLGTKVDIGIRIATMAAVGFLLAESCRKPSPEIPTPVANLENVIFTTQHDQERYDHDIQTLATQMTRLDERIPTPTVQEPVRVPTRDSKPYGK